MNVSPDKRKYFASESNMSEIDIAFSDGAVMSVGVSEVLICTSFDSSPFDTSQIMKITFE